MPSDDEIGDFYPTDYYGGGSEKFTRLIETMVRVVAARHVRFLTRGLPAGARVLDVGCGRGLVLADLADHGYEVHGVERSEAAATGADERADIRIVSKLADAGYPDGWFDEVLIWHVLEHLRDPRETLAEIARILRPGGKVVVAVPNFSSLQARTTGAAWFHLDLPRHLFHFPVEGLRHLLAEVGLAPESTHHFSLRQNPFGWLQSLLNRIPGIPRNALYVLLHERAPDAPPPFTRRLRVALRLAYWFGMPIAGAFSIVTALLRTGATIHVVASKPRSG